MPDSSSKSGSPRQPSSRPPFRRDPQDNLHHGPLSGGIGRGSAFRAGMPDSSSKSGSPRQPSWDWPGIRFSSWNAGFQLEKRIPKTTFITAPFQEGLDWPVIRFSSWNAGFQLEKRIPKTTFTGRGSAFRAGMPDSSSKSGSPRQPSSRPPFRRDWPGIRFSSWNAGFQLEKRIPKTTLMTAPWVRFFRRDCALFFRTFGCFFPLCGVRTFSARSAEPLPLFGSVHLGLSPKRGSPEPGGT